MSPTASLDANLAALARAADRAGTALACLFSSADEFEAELIRERRARGYYRSRSKGPALRRAGLSVLLAAVLLLL